MGQSIEQGEIIRDFSSALGVLATERGWRDVLCATDNFFAWVSHEPLVRVSPDVYVLDEPPPPSGSWQTWLPGHKPPRWALEIVSQDWKKDYEQAPLKYAQLGTSELVIFDPETARSDKRREPRVPLQIYRRDSEGALTCVYRGEGPAASAELDAFLVWLPCKRGVRLRLARNPAGTDLVPTAEEALQTAEMRIRELEAELARVRGT